MNNAGLHKCETPDCLRLVSAGSAHCCGACALAAAGKYEIHESGPLGHSAWCDERAAERGPWLTPAQAVEKLMDDAAERRASETRAGGWLPGVVVDERVPPGVIALASDSHVIAYRQDTGTAAEMRRDEHGQWDDPTPLNLEVPDA